MKIMTFEPYMQDALEDFFERCFVAVGIPFSPEGRHADIADIQHHYMENGYFWCLFDEDTLAGTVAVRVIDHENKIIELKRMFVLPEYQGRGYGRALLEMAINYSKNQGFSKLCLDTRKSFSKAVHLYRSSGFREIEKYNDNNLAELFFELIL